MNVTYPDDYTDYDKAMYDTLMLQGQAYIGKKIHKNDAFLLDLAAKATINKIKNNSHCMTEEEIELSRKMHKEAMETLEHTTPEGLYPEGEHPLERNQSNIIQNEDIIEV